MSEKIICKYHEEVICRRSQCKGCGWEPRNEWNRKEALLPLSCIDCKYYRYVKSHRKQFKKWWGDVNESLQKTSKRNNPPSN